MYSQNWRIVAALKDLHIIARTPEPLEFLNDDNTPVGQMNRKQLEAIVSRLREQEETRIRMKRERSSETIVGDGDDAGDSHPDFVELRSVDLRAMRRAKRVKQLPTPDAEVIELD
jgi:hypothetical protein